MYEQMKRDLSYVQGLLDGESGHRNHPDHKALFRLAETVDKLVEAVEHLERRHTELEEYVEMIDEDLDELELQVYEKEDDEDLVEIVCPECGEEVLVDEDDLDDRTLEVLCPNCHTVLEMENMSGEESDHVIEDRDRSVTDGTPFDRQ
jgi:hypothetical protein